MGLFRVIDELLAANSRYSVKKMKQFRPPSSEVQHYSILSRHQIL
ncbi:hypothetical protein Psal006b_00484 [Piscirickettsia salmonis]|uniref:Transposase n=1 Tax=Piscirickettsia salmonis TaxID=1238 RepID=A0AAC8VK81_PISSA|nr:transposase [Piscirickettsia salmonis]QGN97529.1 hypothetical protein Psal006b_00484 [Piscirickettsia salmonis]QGO01132.1 hypothetical protein Psal008_00492 [Piscirickettsia salmonis]QGO11847.1 hypothetical protein Psal010b_00483 [Piscirickettsia salmonis]QGO18874.1 hypothetical protein Psal013_00488 [Piscirickettsia salmonis]